MIRVCTIVIISLLTLMSCKVVDDNTDSSSQTPATYRIATSEVSGWTETAAGEGGWVPFTKGNMDELVDGEAVFYTDGGMVEGAQQILVNSSSEKLNAWLLDFSSRTTANQMFQKIKTEKVTTPKTVTGFNESVAIINTSGEGCTAYAVFGTFILRLSFENYGDVNESVADATQYLKLYEKR